MDGQGREAEIDIFFDELPLFHVAGAKALHRFDDLPHEMFGRGSPRGHTDTANSLKPGRVDLPGVVDIGLSFGPGDVLNPSLDDRSRHMHLIAWAPSLPETEHLVSQVRDLISIEYA